MEQEKLHGSPTYYSLLEEMKETHNKKSHDYASNNNPSGNYHFAGQLSKLFNNPDDSGFIGRIGEKLYRLANLENNNKVPANETIEDTEKDICVITALWMADRRDRRKVVTPQKTRDVELNMRVIEQIPVKIPAPLPGESFENYAVRIVRTTKTQIAVAL